jgi:NADPH:quinone reductase-like Zn-dependent oxidoreductase
MRAARFHTYGEPEVLVVEDVAEPHARPGQVRVRVQAASVNAIDWKSRAGYLREMMPLELPAIPGSDATGVVDEVGEGVAGVQVGDSVFGLGVGGTTADYALLHAWAPVPPRWTVAQAGAAGLVSATASAGLDALGDLEGKTILVEGAAGGVGSAAVELAIARGATVIGTASEPKHDFLRSLGAIPTTYGDGLADRVALAAPHRVDAALDTVGSGSLADLIAIVGDAGKVASVADYTAQSLGAVLTGGDASPAASLAAVSDAGARGAYTPRVEATFAPDQTAQAHALAQGGHVAGKVVVVF